ncbi:MAG: type I DNA topoisomerase [Deltaproteobacteria bacterium]|jgi:DNA topoisomerase-1|nr:type I DNA topoisomerase [Deltaproteobacteria bacterium]
MNLLIVESPGKVKKIQGFLGNGWKVAASVGHVRDLPLKEIGVSPPNFKPRYVETDRGHKIISGLRKLAAQASQVYLATDPDREGEAIAWHLQDALGLTDPERITYTEITQTAVLKAIGKPRKIDKNLVQAQEARRVLDRLVGYLVSPVLVSTVGQFLSAGRVQSPALKLVVERDEAIKSFRQTTHFGAEITFDAIPNVSPGWKAAWNNKNWLQEGQDCFLDKSAAEQIAALQNFTVLIYEEGEARQAPPAPFTTSTLQQAASNALKIDPKRTMVLAQKLYEDGHITYMRTDSPNLSAEAIADIRALASQNDWPVPPKPRTWKSKAGAQEAHEAVRPTHVEAESAGETSGEIALYKMIRLRAIASQLEEARFATVKAVLRSELDGKDVFLEAKGRRQLAPGWKILTADDQANADDEEKEEDALNSPVPVLQVGSQVWAASGEVKTKKTVPPSRFTQAALIRELEKRGIGRPSTYASILDNILTRGYIRPNEKRMMVSTPVGCELIAALKTNFGFLDYEYTKKMEDHLDEIAEGKNDYLTVITILHENLKNELKVFQDANVRNCPDCGQPLKRLIKTGTGGYNFWGCSDREKCGAKFKDADGQPGEKIIPLQFSLPDFKCSVCGQPLKHLIKEGPNGFNFWACSDRDKCGARFEDADGQPGAMSVKAGFSDFKCQSCKSPLFRRKGHSAKTGKDYDFFACSNKKCGKTYQTEYGKPDFPAKKY